MRLFTFVHSSQRTVQRMAQRTMAGEIKPSNLKELCTHATQAATLCYQLFEAIQERPHRDHDDISRVFASLGHATAKEREGVLKAMAYFSEQKGIDPPLTPGRLAYMIVAGAVQPRYDDIVIALSSGMMDPSMENLTLFVGYLRSFAFCVSRLICPISVIPELTLRKTAGIMKEAARFTPIHLKRELLAKSRQVTWNGTAKLPKTLDETLEPKFVRQCAAFGEHVMEMPSDEVSVLSALAVLLASAQTEEEEEVKSDGSEDNIEHVDEGAVDGGEGSSTVNGGS